MSRGVLIAAHDSPEIAYSRIAYCSALMARHHLGVGVTLASDEDTVGSLRTDLGREQFDAAFEDVLIIAPGPAGSRRVHDGRRPTRTIRWKNWSRLEALCASRYDETLLIDADYLIQNDTLNRVWGLPPDIMMNRQAVLLSGGETPVADTRLGDTGIPMCWATVIFARRSELRDDLCRLIEHVRRYYDHHGFAYGYPTGMFRNDYAFSVATHLLNGAAEDGDTITPLPCPAIVTSLDKDDIFAAPERGELIFLVEGNRPVRTSGVSVHVMNKFSLLRAAPTLTRLYGGRP